MQAAVDGLLALPQVFVGNGGEVFEVVEVEVGQIGGLRVDVARHGEVDQEQRPVMALFHRCGNGIFIQQQGRGRGGEDGYVDERQMILPRLERNDQAVDRFGEVERALGRA